MKTGGTERRRRESQGGYALLLVFLMAAIVALMLYQQLPRVAFESEREKEQLLIDRGEQYIRAIQLYYVANNRQWPTSIDDLEKREKRFLRRRYVDPYTGKDEWRIIHTTGGFLTDSLVTKPPASGDAASQNASNTNSSTAADGQPQINAAVLQRPSDRPVTPLGGFEQPAIVQQDPSVQANNFTIGQLPPISLTPQQGQGPLPPITLTPGAGNQPGLPPITLTPTGPAGGQQGQIPGQQPGGIFRPGANPTPTPFPGQNAGGGLPGGVQGGTPPGFRIDANGQLIPVTPVAGQTLGQVPGQPQGAPGQIPGLPFSPQPTNQPNNPPNLPNNTNQPGTTQGSPNAALNLINQLLTSPRQTTAGPVTSGGNQVGGIAGIASTHKGPSIKVYKDQGQYELWEFVFTPTASTLAGGQGGGSGGGQQQGGQQGGGQQGGGQQGGGQGRGGFNQGGAGQTGFGGGGSIFGGGAQPAPRPGPGR